MSRRNDSFHLRHVSGQTTSPNARLLCFGDSLTEGYTQRGRVMHPYARQLYQTMIEGNSQKIVVDEAGWSGEVTEDMIPRLKEILQSATVVNGWYDMILLLGGTNDVCHELDTSGIIQRIRTLHEAALAHSLHTRTIAMTIPEIATPKPGSMEAMRGPSSSERAREKINATIKSWPKEEAFKGRMFVFDLAEMMPQHTLGPISSSVQSSVVSVWDPDLVHFSVAGYDFIGEQLAKFIREKNLLPEVKASTKEASSVSNAAAME